MKSCAAPREAAIEVSAGRGRSDDGGTYLQYRETHVEHVLRRRAKFTRLGVMAQSAVETSRSTVKCTEVSMGHSDALLDHVPGIRLELHLELPTLRRVALVGLLDPGDVFRGIGDKLL